MTEHFHMQLVSDAARCVTEIANQGIDSRLTGFVYSSFYWAWRDSLGHLTQLNSVSEPPQGKFIINVLSCDIHPNEMEILLRRLDEFSDTDDPLADEADSLLRDIIEIQYE